MADMIAGAVAMAFAVAGLFFYRFWRQTADRLFALFSLSFFVLAVNRAAIVVAEKEGYPGDYFYWIRAVAFGLFLAAILDKNRKR